MVLISYTSGSTTFTNAMYLALDTGSGPPAVVELGEGWTIIGANAFQENSVLTSITIPASVTSIGDYAFYRCNNLRDVVFESGSQLQTIGDQAFPDSGLSGTITIPASVTSIGQYAFSFCTGLTGVVFESGSQLQTIGDDAFYNSPLSGISDEYRSVCFFPFLW